MKPRRIPSDHVGPVKAFLTGQAATDIAGATVAKSLPQGWDPAMSPPAVVVASDPGSMSEWPVYTGEQIRVAVWADGETEARRLARLCLGWLLSLRVPGIGVRSGTGLLVTRDKDTGGYIAGFTVRTRARTTSF